MKSFFYFAALFFLMLSSCSKEQELIITENEEKEKVPQKVSISGYVQKGPFINGTSITINELNEEVVQTGKTFTTQINNNEGSFQLENIELVSDFVSLRADGFYFNEISGEQSNSQITLYALADLADTTANVNVNVLTHLEKPRVEYLISEGMEFSVAKLQAQQEVLSIFGYDVSDIESSEYLDITKSGKGHGILLTASVILNGYRSEAEFTELMSNISNDLREDGELNDSTLGSQLINHARFLDTSSIRQNLEQRYKELGIESEISEFQPFVSDFVENTPFEITESLIQYPEEGAYGPNLLDPNKTFYSAEKYSFAANLPKGTEVTIKLTGIGQGIWGSEISTINNWSINQFNFDTQVQYFSSINSDDSSDLWMIIMDTSTKTILVEYFEMGSEEPVMSKTITVINNWASF